MENKIITYLEVLVLQQKSKEELIKLILELQERDKKAVEQYGKLYKRLRQVEENYKKELALYEEKAEKYLNLYAEADIEKEDYKRVADLKLGKAYDINANWIDKIVFVLKAARRPLRSSEILNILLKNDIAFRTLADQRKALSAHLNRAMKYGRIIGKKYKGENGYSFKLPE